MSVMNQTEPSDYESEDETQLTLFEFINEITSDIKDWEILIRFPRINGINIERLSGPSDGGHYQNGFILRHIEDGYIIELYIIILTYLYLLNAHHPVISLVNLYML